MTERVLNGDLRERVVTAVRSMFAERPRDTMVGMVTRATHALEYHDVWTCDDLRRTDPSVICRWKNVGKLTADVLYKVQSDLGVTSVPKAADQRTHLRRLARRRWSSASRDDRWAVLGLLRVEAADPRGLLTDERIAALRAAIAVLEALEPAGDAGKDATP